MGATAKTIWQVPAYLPYLQPALTAQALDAAERKIGYKLPRELVELLAEQNGGYIRHTLQGVVHDSIAGIGPHYPSLTDIKWDEVEEYVDFPLEGLVPFDGDGHWHLCLDYRKNRNSPSVSWIDIESSEQEPIASSFAEYLAKLQIDAKDEFAILGVASEEDLAKRIADLLNVQFEPPSSWDHGYSVRRAGFKRGDEQEWIWISPNRVPRGFVRKNDRRYQELSALMPGFARRFPELDEDAVLLQATEGVRQHLVSSMTESGITVRPLQGIVDAR